MSTRLPSYMDIGPKMDFFPPNAFLRRRRKKALLRVNDRGGGWKMCILALCRVYVRARGHVCSYFTLLWQYSAGRSPQSITIHDLVKIYCFCARRTRRLNLIFMSFVLLTISTTWFNNIDNNHSILSCYP